MGKTTLTIQEVEHKVSQAGKPYLRVKADGEWYSAFDKSVIEALEKSPTKAITVEMVTSGDFKNIRKVYSEEVAKALEVAESIPSSSGKKAVDKEASIRAGVAYRFAIDLVVAGKIAITDINLYATDLLEGMSKLAEWDELEILVYDSSNYNSILYRSIFRNFFTV